MNITIACKLPPESLSPEQVWKEAVGWAERMATVHEYFAKWWANPRGPKDPYVPLADRHAFIDRISQDDRKLASEFPSVPSYGSSGVVMTNAGNDKDWAKHGRNGFSFSPDRGDLRMHLYGIEKIYDQPERIAWAVLSAFVGDSRITFAQTNVQQLVNKELLLYSLNRAPFPHRGFLGWMGYVPQALTTEQVPNAAKLERKGSGTLILATPLLDLSDPAAIKQANQVEMSLVDLDLLPVIDPDLM